MGESGGRVHRQQPAAEPQGPRGLGRAAREVARGKAAPGIASSAAQGPGAPLQPDVRRDFEHRLGHDFGAVRVHTGNEAARASSALDASGFTLGRNVVLGGGVSDQASPVGRRILAHELRHVVQQAGFLDGDLDGAPVLDASHPSEHEARAETGPLTPLAAPAVQLGPPDLVIAGQHVEIDLNTPDWADAVRAVTDDKKDVLYVLRETGKDIVAREGEAGVELVEETVTNVFRKVGKTELGSEILQRMGSYRGNALDLGKELYADVFTFEAGSDTAETVEAEARAGMEKIGAELGWDNTRIEGRGPRLGRPGQGIPKATDASSELLEEGEQVRFKPAPQNIPKRRGDVNAAARAKRKAAAAKKAAEDAGGTAEQSAKEGGAEATEQAEQKATQTAKKARAPRKPRAAKPKPPPEAEKPPAPAGEATEATEQTEQKATQTAKKTRAPRKPRAAKPKPPPEAEKPPAPAGEATEATEQTEQKATQTAKKARAPRKPRAAKPKPKAAEPEPKAPKAEAKAPSPVEEKPPAPTGQAGEAGGDATEQAAKKATTQAAGATETVAAEATDEATALAAKGSAQVAAEAAAGTLTAGVASTALEVLSNPALGFGYMFLEGISGDYHAAWNAIKAPARVRGFAEGMAARFAGLELHPALLMIMPDFVNKPIGVVVVGGEGMEEQALVEGAAEGWRYAGGFPAERSKRELDRAAGRLKARGGPELDYDVDGQIMRQSLRNVGEMFLPQARNAIAKWDALREKREQKEKADHLRELAKYDLTGVMGSVANAMDPEEE